MAKQKLDWAGIFKGMMLLEITSAITVLLYMIYTTLWVVIWPITAMAIYTVLGFIYFMILDICKTYTRIKVIRVKIKHNRDLERRIEEARRQAREK